MTRLIIAGSRDFNDFSLLETSVNNILRNKCGPIQIISGTAMGADSLGELYAQKYNYEVVRFPADWNRYGKRAGYLRNAEMARYSIMDESSGVLIAFWDGESRGTQHMINLAQQYGLEVHIVRF